MRLMGRDISTQNVLAAVSERLLSRGLSGLPDAGEVTPEGIEARVDPLSFYVSALGDHADATRALPIETHRDGLSGRAVVLAKTAFRRVGQIFINEALARQVVFNGHARDSYAQLSAEVVTLRKRIAQLEQALSAKSAEASAAELTQRDTLAPVAPAKAQAKVTAAKVGVKSAAPAKLPVARAVKAAAKVASAKPKPKRKK